MKPSVPVVPAGLFGIVLGVVGLANAWRTASKLWGLPAGVGEAISFAGVGIWCTLLILYGAKVMSRRVEANAEFRHPVLCCFLGLIPLSTALVGGSTYRYGGAGSMGLVVIGVLGTVAFAVYRSGALWKGGRDDTATTPVLYLPGVAGNFGSAIALGGVGHAEWGVPLFGAGLLAWLAIESVLLHRLYLVSELAVGLRPTMGIQLAPPAVGCYAYLSVTSGPPDLIVQVLIGYALFQLMILLRMLPWIREQAFAASYWAFSFGIAALTTSLNRFVERGGTGPLAELAPYVFAFANLVIGILALGTVALLLRGKLLPPPLVNLTSTAKPS